MKASQIRQLHIDTWGFCLLTDEELERWYQRRDAHSSERADATLALRVDAAPAPAPKAPAKRRDPVREAWDASWRSDAAPSDHTAEMRASELHALNAHLQNQAKQSAEHNRQSGRGDLVRAAFEASFTEFDRRQAAAADAELERGHAGAATKDPVAEAYAASWRRGGS